MATLCRLDVFLLFTFLNIISNSRKENMGYPSMGGDIKTFDVIRSEADPSVTTFITYTKFVGYDDNKNRVDISIPQIKDTIKWRFLIQKDVWD